MVPEEDKELVTALLDWDFEDDMALTEDNDEKTGNNFIAEPKT